MKDLSEVYLWMLQDNSVFFLLDGHFADPVEVNIEDVGVRLRDVKCCDHNS